MTPAFVDRSSTEAEPPGKHAPPHARLLVFGLGYSAARFVSLYGGGFAAVTATRRELGEAVAGVDVLAFDGRTAGVALHHAVAAATHILISIPPDADGDPLLRLLGDAIELAPSLRWIGYLSTVGVYGGFDGAWIDETTVLRPVSARGRRRAAIEQAWLGLARPERCVQVFRLAGIYGPGRSAIDAVLDGTARRIVKPDQVFNRIHVDDIAGAVMAGMTRPRAATIVNVTDNEPAPPQDVVAYAARLLDREPPPEIPFEQAELTPMGRSFYGENKRVSNRVLRDELGYAPLYPTYREGLRACLDTRTRPAA